MMTLNLKPFSVESITTKYILIEGVIFGSDFGQLIPSAISFRYKLGMFSDFSEVITIQDTENVMNSFLEWFDNNIEDFNKDIHKFNYF